MNKIKSYVAAGVCLLLSSLYCFAGNLLMDASAPLKPKLASSAIRERFVTINPKLVDALSIPGSQFDLTLFDGEVFTLQVDKVTSASSNSLTIRCSVPGQPWNFMVLARENGAFAGTFHAKNRMFQLASTGTDLHILREVDPNVSVSCGVVGKTEPTPVYPSAIAPMTSSGTGSSSANVAAGEMIASATPAKATLDVLVVYTPAVLTYFGSEDAVVSSIKLAMAEGQQALDNSQVNVQVRLVHTEMVNYSETGDLNTDLTRLGNPSDGFLDGAIALRDKYKADILSLWVDQSSGNMGGLGYQLLPNVTLYTYNVIWAHFATGTYIPIHEIGHNFGCDHEPAFSLAQPLYPYAHAYSFQSPALLTHDTVMTAVWHPGQRIANFSNPNVFYDDGSGAVPTGTTNAFNALVMNNTAAKLTSFRAAPSLGEAVDAPTIAWTSGGDNKWFWQPGITHDNSDAAQSAPIGDNQSTWLQGPVRGPARLTFWSKVSSEANQDFLSFYIDGVQQWSHSGEVDWTQETFFIPSGAHSIEWIYSKNGSTSTGKDAAWVDQVVVQPLKLPTVTITSPAANARLFLASANVTGTAHDDVQVHHVEYQVRNLSGTSSWKTAIDTINWTAPVDFVAGTNIITVRSIGFGGQTSLPVSRTVFFVVTNQLTMAKTGMGTFTPNLNGKFLEVGRPYTVTAIASNNWLFSNWSGSVNSTNAALTFVMQSNMFLQANFVTNPFLPQVGVYNGLFHEADAVRMGSAGFITFTLAKPGTYSGRLYLDGLVYVLSGRFGLNGQSHLVVPRFRTNSVTVDMGLTFGSDAIEGQVSNGTWASGLGVYRNPFNAINNKATGFAGKYTVVIPGASDPTTAPAGDSVATVTIDLGGIVHATGTLADGTPFSQTVGIDRNGDWPLFVPLYANKGLLLADAYFNTPPGSVAAGQATWIKPPMRTSYYSNGFTLNTSLTGSSFVTPSNGVRILSFTNGTLTLSGANLPFTISNPVVLNANNTMTVMGTNGTVVVFNKVTGSMSGSHFIDPVKKTAVPINAVVLQNQNVARGFFRGTNQTGAVLLQAD